VKKYLFALIVFFVASFLVASPAFATQGGMDICGALTVQLGYPMGYGCNWGGDNWYIYDANGAIHTVTSSEANTYCQNTYNDPQAYKSSLGYATSWQCEYGSDKPAGGGIILTSGITTDTILGAKDSLLGGIGNFLPIAAIVLISVIIVYFIIRHFRNISDLGHDGDHLFISEDPDWSDNKRDNFYTYEGGEKVGISQRDLDFRAARGEKGFIESEEYPAGKQSFIDYKSDKR
jgi:hypothetical protein